MVDPIVKIETPSGTLVGNMDLHPGQNCIVFVHGFGSTRLGEKARALRRACHRTGMGFATFDLQGHGDSYGSLQELRISQWLADLDAIADYLLKRGPTRLYLFGSSMGGFVSAWFALRRPEAIAALVLVAPALHFLQRRLEALTDEQLEQAKRTGRFILPSPYLGDVELPYALLEEEPEFNPTELAAGWRVPSLIWHSMEDDTVDWRDTAEMVAALRPGRVELRLFRDGDHRLNDRAEELAVEALRFIKPYR